MRGRKNVKEWCYQFPSLVFIQYCYKAPNRTLLHTGIKIPPNYWDQKQRCVSEKLPPAFDNAAQLNKELRQQFRIVEDLVTYAIESKIADTGAFVKNSFSPAMETAGVETKIKEVTNAEGEQIKAKKDIYYQFDEYIKSKQRKVSRQTLTVYGNVKSHLLAFEQYRNKKITFQCFDFSFYEDFVGYLTFEHIHMRRQTVLTSLKLNTIGKPSNTYRDSLRIVLSARSLLQSI